MTVERSHIGPRQFAKLNPKALAKASLAELKNVGIGMDESDLRKLAATYGMDAITPLQFPSNISLPEQFLQNWLTGVVQAMFAARKIDELAGVSTIGDWEDEEVIQSFMEPTGVALPYGDYTNVPFANWNNSFERRSIVRFEQGMRVGKLEEARSAKININSAEAKRVACGLSLDIVRNKVGFFGYNATTNRTYGFLNDPNLPAYVTVAATGTGSTTTWSTKTFQQIITDIRTAVQQLRTQMQGNLSTTGLNLTLALPTSVYEYLTTTTDFGVSVVDWINKTYPSMRIVDVPELAGANGGANVFYLYVENVADTSTDDGRTFTQIVPARFQLVGVAQLTKGIEEDYTNALGGLLCKRPYAVVRFSGI